MAFEKAENFLFLAAKKYRLDRQAQSGLVCERARKYLKEKYDDLSKNWKIQKFENDVLFISAKNSASKTELFLRTHEILEFFSETNDFPTITEIRIMRE